MVYKANKKLKNYTGKKIDLSKYFKWEEKWSVLEKRLLSVKLGSDKRNNDPWDNRDLDSFLEALRNESRYVTFKIIKRTGDSYFVSLLAKWVRSFPTIWLDQNHSEIVRKFEEALSFSRKLGNYKTHRKLRNQKIHLSLVALRNVARNWKYAESLLKRIREGESCSFFNELVWSNTRPLFSISSGRLLLDPKLSKVASRYNYSRKKRIFKQVTRCDLEWIEENKNHLLQMYREAIQSRAKKMFDLHVKVDLRYSYNDRLKQDLEDRGVDYYEVEFDHEGREYRFLKWSQPLGTLRELAGEWSPRFGDGQLRATDVRYQIRRQVRYLYKTIKGIESMTLSLENEGDEFKPQYTSQQKFNPRIADYILPKAYPSILQMQIKMKKWENQFTKYLKPLHGVTSAYGQTLYEMYQILGDEVLRYADKAIKTNTMNALHDAIFPFSGRTPWLTKTALRKLISEKPNKSNEILTCLSELFESLKLTTLKEQRALARNIILAEDPLKMAKEMLNEAQAKEHLETLAKVKVSEEQVDAFLSRMKRYAETVGLGQMLRLFGTKMTSQVLNGTYQGVFQPKEFSFPLEILGGEIQKALGKKGIGAAVKNPKRLYKHLSQFGFVPSMMKGNIQRPEKLLQILHQFGHALPKELKKALTLTAKIEPKCSPEFLVAGNASVCCMSFGESNAKTYARERGFGVVNFYLGDRVIANSVIWINQLPVGQALVLDNTEVHPNYEKFNPYLKTLYKDVIHYLMVEHDCVVSVLGQGYSDLTLDVVDHPIREFQWVIQAKDVKRQTFYTDAKTIVPVGTTQSNEEMERWYERMVKAGSKLVEVPYESQEAPVHMPMAAGDFFPPTSPLNPPVPALGGYGYHGIDDNDPLPF